MTTISISRAKLRRSVRDNACEYSTTDKRNTAAELQAQAVVDQVSEPGMGAAFAADGVMIIQGKSVLGANNRPW